MENKLLNTDNIEQIRIPKIHDKINAMIELIWQKTSIVKTVFILKLSEAYWLCFYQYTP